MTPPPHSADRPSADDSPAAGARPAPAHRPWIVGLTGGIGSGKSTVAEGFVARGIVVVDADAIAHELTGPDGEAMPRIAADMGKAFVAPDGSLDRARMREHVFAHPEARQTLQSILHPMIRARSDARLAMARSPYVIAMVPLLVESADWRQRVDRVLVVDVPEALQIERVQRRSGMDASLVQRIMASQATRAQRLAAADDIIDNRGDPGQLADQIAALDTLYRQLAPPVRAAGLPDGAQ